MHMRTQRRFMPLLLDHMEEAGPAGRVMLTGQGLGGALAALLLLMCAARGVRTSAFAPVYTLNAPAVLCEVPDFKQWCSKDGCSLQDMDGMMEDLLHRGILSQLVRCGVRVPCCLVLGVCAVRTRTDACVAGAVLSAASAARSRTRAPPLARTHAHTHARTHARHRTRTRRACRRTPCATSTTTRAPPRAPCARCRRAWGRWPPSPRAAAGS
jgi:hypothetical protein